MTWRRRVRRAFRLGLESRADASTAVDEELDLHLDLCVDELVGSGWSPELARQEALRKFGDIEFTRTYCARMQMRRGREERRAMRFEEFVQDVRFALRTLMKSPGYAALVVVTLAFGVAANTTIFSVMNPYLFRPLPYGDPDELIHVNVANPITGWDMDRFSLPQYMDWKERSRAFEDLAAYAYGSSNLTGGRGPEAVAISQLTSNMFSVLRAEPILGRTFRPEEGLPGGEKVAVMAESLWRRRYAADPGAVGRSIMMDGVPHVVIGIMPERFNFPFGTAKLWVPIQGNPVTTPRDRTGYQFVGRLNDGWTRERAHAELSGVLADLSRAYPDIDGRMSAVTVKPVREALNFVWDTLNLTFRVLLGAVVFVLLIACVNVASLTLARAGARRRELSVRSAMGGRRARLVRQLVTESLVLAGAGGVLGVALAYWATGLLNSVIPEQLYRVGDIDIDLTVMAFSVVLTFATPVAFGLIPALSATRGDLAEGLKEGSKSSGSLSRARGRRLLVVAQVSLAVVLITGAGLMLRSFAEIQRLDLGFDAGRLVVSEAVLPANDYPSAQERLAFVEEAVAALEATPGVQAAAAVRWLPLNNETISYQVGPPEMAGTPGDEWPLATLNVTHSGYFETMGITLLTGRDFTRADAPESRKVAIVSEPLAERFWPGESAVGQTLLAGRDPSSPERYAVVGVVDAVRHSGLSGDETGDQMYVPTTQLSGRRYFVLARTDAEPGALIPSVRRVLRAVDPDLPTDIRPMTAVLQESQQRWSVSTAFLAVVGAGALLLAALGIYGLISFSVSQRRMEMGVRMALGATRGGIRAEVVGDGVRLATVGLALGMVAAVALARVVSSILFGVGPYDPITLGAVLTLFLGVATLASVVPAERASRADPLAALRAD